MLVKGVFAKKSGKAKGDNDMQQESRTIRQRVQDQKGFTLIEVLIVVGIVALLVAFIAPNLFSAQARSQEKICKSKATVLDRAIVDYKLEYNKSPIDNDTTFNNLIRKLMDAGVLDDNEDNRNLASTGGNTCGEGEFKVEKGHIVWEKSNTTETTNTTGP